MKEFQASPFVKDVQALVQIPSVSGSETAAQKHLHEKLQTFGTTLPESAGFSTWLQPVEGYESPNLVAHIKGNNGKGSKKALILTGHVDTVSPAGKPEEWEGENPWSGEIVEQSDGAHAIYGVGSSDMKMGLTVLRYVFEDLAHRKNLDCDVWFVASINEELNGAGTQAFAKWFKEQGLVGQYSQGIAAIFGEPRNVGSDKTSLGIGNRGNDFLIAEKTVGSHHSGELGPNVAFDTGEFLQGLHSLNSAWKSMPVEEGFTPPTINPTQVATPNDNLNSTPGAASIHMDLRSTPSTNQSALEQVKALAHSLGFTVEHCEIPAPGAYTSPDAPLVKAFQDVLLQEGTEVDSKTSPHSTDAGFLQEIGITQNIMAGAGTKEWEHTVNEKAILEEGERAIGLTVLAALEWVKKTGENKETVPEITPILVTPEIGKIEIGKDIDFFVIIAYDGQFAMSGLAQTLTEKYGLPLEQTMSVLNDIYHDIVLSKLTKDIGASFSQQYPHFQIHSINEGGELDTTLFQRAQEKITEGYAVITMHPMFEEDFLHNLKTTRIFYLGGDTIVGQGHRPGSEPLDKQVQKLKKKLQGKKVILLEDDTHSGQTLRATSKDLAAHGITVEEVLLGSQVHNPGVNQVDLPLSPLIEYLIPGDDIYTTNDFLDMRDMLWGATGGGYGTLLPNGQHVRAPLGLPFTSPTARLSIPKDKEVSFSQSLLQLNREFYTQAQKKLGVTIHLGDVSSDFSTYIMYVCGDVAGFTSQTPMLDVIGYVERHAEALETIIKTLGVLQKEAKERKTV